MNRKTAGALLGAIVLVFVSAGGALAAAPPSVSVRVEGVKRTLLLPQATHTHSGWITLYGAPKGECSARSAQGALDVATKHHWGGSWETSFQEYEVLTILGETHKFTSKYYWDVFVNDVAASVGACDLRLHRGEQLLFAAVPQTSTAYPTAISAPKSATAGVPFSVKVVFFNAKGSAEPLAGARVGGSGVSATTNQHGVATVTATRAGTLVLRAQHSWSTRTAYVRSVPVTVHVS